MKKGLLILMVVAGMIVLLGGLLIYGLGINEIVPVPRPDLMCVRFAWQENQGNANRRK